MYLSMWYQTRNDAMQRNKKKKNKQLEEIAENAKNRIEFDCNEKSTTFKWQEK